MVVRIEINSRCYIEFGIDNHQSVVDHPVVLFDRMDGKLELLSSLAVISVSIVCKNSVYFMNLLAEHKKYRISWKSKTHEAGRFVGFTLSLFVEVCNMYFCTIFRLHFCDIIQNIAAQSIFNPI